MTPVLSPAFFSTQHFFAPKSSENAVKQVRASARFSPSGAGGASGGHPDALLAPSSERRVHRSISPRRGNSACIRAPSRSKSRRKRRLTSKHACGRSPLPQRPFAFAGTPFIGLGIKVPQKISPNWGQFRLFPPDGVTTLPFPEEFTKPRLRLQIWLTGAFCAVAVPQGTQGTQDSGGGFLRHLRHLRH